MPYIGKQPANVPVSAEDIPDNSINAAKIVDGSITIADIANDAVTVDKLANSINTAIAANTAKTGITSAQTNAITANTAKTGITSSQANAITANTSKTTNATHSGEVTGSGALTITNDAVTSEKIADNVALGGNPTTTTQSSGDNTTKIATTAYVTAKVTALIGGAPGTLDTLNELAEAINDDDDYNSTLTTALATKLPLAGGTMTGNIAHAGAFTLDAGGDIHLDTGGQTKFDKNGTNYGIIFNSSNNLGIHVGAQDKDLVISGNDGGSTITALTLDMSDGGAATFNSYIDLQGNNLYIADNAKALFGTGEDLHIYHENTNHHSYIWEKGSGDLYLRGTDVRIKSNTDNDDMATFIENGAASLFYSNAKKFETTAAGATVTGALTVNGGSVFNEASADVDFRIESNAYTHAFMLQGSDGFVGLGINVPLNLLHLRGGSDNSSTGAPIIRMQKQSGGAVADGHTIGGMSFWVNDDGVDSGASKERAKIIAESQNTSSATRLEFWTSFNNAAIEERMRIAGDGKVGIGVTSPSSSLDISTTAETTGALAGHGIRLEAIGAANETVVPITASFVGSQERARAGIGFIAKDQDGAAGYGGAIGFYTRAAADGSALTKSDERVRIDATGGMVIKAGLQIVTGTVVGTGNSGGTLSIQGGATYPGGKIRMRGGQAGGDFKVYTGGSTSSPAEAFHINSAGKVMMPLQPAFDAYHAAESYSSGATVSSIDLNAVRLNRGNHYNTSNDRFTAPVAGVYKFNYRTIIYGNYLNAHVKMLKNGNQISGSSSHYTSSAGNYWNTWEVFCLVSLAANDYVQVAHSANTTIHGNDYQSFNGYLLG